MALRTSAVALLLALCATTAIASELSLQTSGRKMLQSRGSSVKARLDMAQIDAMDETEPYRVLMLLAWQQLTSSSRRTGPFTYWSLAGVHGKMWAYNGVESPSTGFCRHQVPGFGPWHRAYLRQFELALIDAAKEAASKFEDRQLRSLFVDLADSIRLPYYDWTNPRIPDLLTARTVHVLDFETGRPITIRNPFNGYQFVAAAGDGRGPGRMTLRGSTWSQTMSRSARRFGMEMASFLRSNTWRCTYLTGVGCTGNLESTHNEIHNMLGGTQGEMATVPYAGFDPIFWLHHCMVDRVLWLFQNNGGQWMGAHAYSPFLNLEGDAADTTSYGYVYSGGLPIGSGSTGGRRRSGHGARLESTDADAPVTRVGSAAGKALVRATIQEWTGNYTGYTWSVRFHDMNQQQMEQAVHLLVYLKSNNVTTQADSTAPAKVEDLNDLRMKPNYCGSIAGFNEHVHVHSEVGDKTISRAVDLTQCLREAGKNPNVAAVNPEDFSRGPASVPVHLSDLQIVAVTAKGEDVSDKYNVGKTVISWSVPVTRTAAQVKEAAGADPIESQALAHPLAFGADQEVLSMVVGDAAAI